MQSSTLRSILRRSFFRKQKDICSVIDVSQVLEFPSAKLYSLKQLPFTKITPKITQMSTLKLTLNRDRLFGGGRVREGVLILPHNDFGGESSRGVYLKYSSLLCKNYRNLNYSLTKSSFYIMIFNEKICKIKAFDSYPTLETCGVFLVNR